MAGLLAVLLARIWERVGVLAVSTSRRQHSGAHVSCLLPRHNHFSIKGLGPRIPVWPMDLSSHLCVRLDTTVDGRVAVRRGRVVRVVGDVGCHLALAGQSPSHERVALLAFM